MPYNKCCVELSVLSFENIRYYTDMTTIYKFLLGHVDFQASDVGLHVAASSTRVPAYILRSGGQEIAFPQICFHYLML